MSEWEKAPCPLCGKPAKKRAYKDPRCHIYACGDCWDFGLCWQELEKIKKLSDSDKKKLIEWRRSQPKGQKPVLEITNKMINEILRKKIISY